MLITGGRWMWTLSSLGASKFKLGWISPHPKFYISPTTLQTRQSLSMSVRLERRLQHIFGGALTELLLHTGKILLGWGCSSITPRPTIRQSRTVEQFYLMGCFVRILSFAINLPPPMARLSFLMWV